MFQKHIPLFNGAHYQTVKKYINITNNAPHYIQRNKKIGGKEHNNNVEDLKF